MTYTAHKETIGKTRIEICYDDCFNTWADTLCDWPVAIVRLERYGRFTIEYDNTKIGESAIIAACKYDYYGADGIFADSAIWYDKTENGFHKIETGYAKPRYFKDDTRAIAYAFKEITGETFSDIRVETFGTHRDSFFMVWSQKRLDEYAGIKKAKAPIETAESFVNGEVYGFIISNEDDEHLDSCWGFIGDMEYCLSEARDIAQYYENERLERVAKEIEESRADMYECG